MGYSESELYEADENIIATVLQKSRLGLDFAALAARGTVPVTPEPLITFADLKFATPSGSIEIASARVRKPRDIHAYRCHSPIPAQPAHSSVCSRQRLRGDATVASETSRR